MLNLQSVHNMNIQQVLRITRKIIISVEKLEKKIIIFD